MQVGDPPPPLSSARSCYRLDIKDQLGHWVQPCVWYCYFNKHNSTERSIGFLNPLQRPFFSLVFLSFRIENEVILKFLLNPERMAIQFVTHSLITLENSQRIAKTNFLQNFPLYTVALFPSLFILLLLFYKYNK